MKDEESKKLLEIRNSLKRKKPVFIRQESHKKKKLEQSWRKPRGIHSKLRRMLRGNRARVEPGWGSPAAAKGLSKDGLRKIIVNNPKELSGLDAKADGVVIASSVGMKKRVEIVKKAKELGLRVLSQDSEKFLESFEKMQKEKQEKKAKAAKEKEEKKKEKEEKAAKKEKEEKEKKESEEKKKAGQQESPAEKDEKLEKKKELDKILSKKDAA